jgi:hypothetical protein
VNRLDRTADRLAEAAAPGGDQIGISRIDFAQLARGFIERPAAVQRLVPLPKIGVFDEFQARFVVPDLANQKSVGIPAVENVADVEDDGGRLGRRIQPWRALKRRFVLLMT